MLTDDEARARAFCDRLGLSAGEWLGRELLAPCFRPAAVAGTTGAGDATIAGLLAALLRGDGPAGAATAATAAANRRAIHVRRIMWVNLRERRLVRSDPRLVPRAGAPASSLRRSGEGPVGPSGRQM